ncbi:MULTISPECIES: PatA/PatG family cyanobactin maturation protease [unclassified Microcoleus]|uniref:S8 family peptidase n=1 Tax=unclassified Microcoleus TaxID=2642155 RepID=UPI001DEFE447|nr:MULTISPECIES: PatA/PatG family cyanobactin maturation protease [unclassified Microcoleus]MCC3413905.1 PatA/PatG family cyanobactin maturation protease [Microcoleus sp. PH2017_02_FOX_O_A]MCC3490655.1 PatA/PatG family cyanobactin maturation protease [Microcoleus sp. PH2017_16_JOR_D_A]MCC3515780.1 PatA/PatG family cyanobactin maturation protease [Microcoleus sp. PH2017_18_LLB_O_A]MCC3535470.1 PatA/PatG family cyanobactin maturation protease [Microcoleus sp. PH2017_25_DOB_D_A]MCC3547632.1 PatA/
MLDTLSTISQGNNSICIAVLDGPVDRNHPCFQGADLTYLPTLVRGEAQTNGNMSIHGTHVASIIFGQPGSSVQGIAPRCKGIIVPIFADDRRKTSQLDLARGIEQAVNAGAHVINLSGGQLTDFGEADGWLENAVRLCRENNVLLVAAAGNNGCDCLHVPAALPAVLAVGAMDANGKPLGFSNWGETYQNQGILAPGEDILGAKPGGGTDRLSGTSFATPIVSGVAAVLLSLQRERGETPDPQKVRQILLQSALPCDPDLPEETRRCLTGKLNIPGAITLLKGGNMAEEFTSVNASEVEATGCGCDGSLSNTGEAIATAQGQSPQTSVATAATATAGAVPSNTPNLQDLIQSFPTATTQQPMMPNLTANSVTASQAPSEVADMGQLVYALGTLGYDFGSEARRDSFKQLMPPFNFGTTMVPANPYDARQMVDYLDANISESRSLIWTINIELTPVYAIDPMGPFAAESYRALHELLGGQIQPENDAEYVERVSIPGILTGRKVKLFSGQVIPVIEPQSTRGIYGWKVNNLVAAAMNAVQAEDGTADEDRIRKTLDGFLNRIYYDLRNLGTTSQDRALNFSVTNAFQAAQTFSEAVAVGMELDSVTVEKSPFCRMDSDCWDVKLKFFDPENSRRAKKIFRFTIDVSDLIPVTLGEVRSWSSPY